MSMTREELQQWFAEWLDDYYDELYSEDDLTPEVAESVLTALRSVSRERVEKVWPGCDFCDIADFGEFGFEITKRYAKISCALGSWRFPEKEQFLFCPKCGKPIKDEAVQITLQRLETMKDETD